jgi:catechol 2,3-dioxygenase-like lactoylglutathione lyase family enzyme
MIKGLHHAVYRCRDCEATRRFYEEFLGLRLANALWVKESKTGRAINALHIFFEMGDGSYLAFFEVPDQPFTFKEQHDFDLHVALEVDHATLERMLEKGRAEGRDVRGISDHRFIDSIYLRDPDGYVVELTAKKAGHSEGMDPAKNEARAILDSWQKAKTEVASSGPRPIKSGHQSSGFRISRMQQNRAD